MTMRVDKLLKKMNRSLLGALVQIIPGVPVQTLYL